MHFFLSHNIYALAIKLGALPTLWGFRKGAGLVGGLTLVLFWRFIVIRIMYIQRLCM